VVTGGSWHGCVLDPKGAVSCWGANIYGETSREPEGSFVALASGGSHNCVLDASGLADCWGSDEEGNISGAP
jgi:alpha-tubulin suppressor-like RCC1 family protein